MESDGGMPPFLLVFVFAGEALCAVEAITVKNK
jgi:hypothetical protein